MMYGNDTTSGLMDHHQSVLALPENPTQHFSIRACYKNNGSFRSMVDFSLARLLGRRVFDQTFVNDIWSQFNADHVRASKMLRGLLTLDIP